MPFSLPVVSADVMTEIYDEQTPVVKTIAGFTARQPHVAEAVTKTISHPDDRDAVLISMAYMYRALFIQGAKDEKEKDK